MIVHEDFYSYKNRFFSSTKFLLANGYYGYRGTLSEDKATDMVAWNLNGIYDRVENNWRESINAFNPLFTYIRYQKQKLHPKSVDYKLHYQSLNLSDGTLSRKTVFEINETEIEVETIRFANQKDLNFIHEEYIIKANKDITIGLYQGIDMEVYDISGKHVDNLEFKEDNGILHVRGYSQEKKIKIDVMNSVKCDFECLDCLIVEEQKILRHYTVFLKSGKKYRLFINAGVIHSLENQEEWLRRKLLELSEKHFLDLLSENTEFWKEKWKKSRVEIVGNKEADLALNYDIFQLISHRPYNESVSIPARGLSGQVYKGAVFWDTEMYMFLFYLLTDQISARKLLKYRINGLEKAKEKAKNYNHKGAFYAWESQEEGLDACSDYNLTDPVTNEPIRTYFKELQIHINSAIVYAMDQYLLLTNDKSILSDGGMEMLVEINKFYLDYLTKNKDGVYEVKNVIGPDEYHEHVNNNAYTNYLIHFSFKKMLEYSEMYDLHDNEFLIKNKKIFEEVEFVVDKLFLPKPNIDGIIPQFDGYLSLKDVSLSELLMQKKTENEYLGGEIGLATKTQIIKQADIILLLVLFPDLFSKEVQKINYNYYKSRTEHGSSLSKAVYSIMASRLGYKAETFDYFLTGANIDLTGESKQYAGGIYIGGSHLAAYGGAYMAVILGFLGLDFRSMKLNRNLPDQIKDIKIHLLEG
jgi:kojibiose phosphorylase/nigerose phosphorylase